MPRTYGTTHSSMAEFNRSRIIQILHTQGTCSRAQLARQLHLTPAAITKITANLIEANIIEEAGAIDGLMQRRSIGLQLNNQAWHVIGIKIARSSVTLAIFDVRGQIQHQHTIAHIHESDIQDICQTIKDAVFAMLKNDPSIKAIGIAVPGPYLRNEGRIALATSVSGWQSINFKTEFAQSFPVPTLIEHDARAGAVAQSLFGTFANLTNTSPTTQGLHSANQVNTNYLAYYLLGEGIGLGIISDGILLSGTLGTSTELGHVSIDVHGKPCECGNYGCLETYCSATALHQTMMDHSSYFLQHYQVDPQALTHEQAASWLIAHYPSDDSCITDIMTSAYEAIAYGCVSIINAFNPSIIVLGDTLAQGGDALLSTITQICKQRVLPELWQSTHVVTSQLPVDATLLGAGAIATQELLAHPSSVMQHT